MMASVRIYNMLYRTPCIYSERTTSHTIPNITQPLHYLPPNEIASHSSTSTVLYYIYSEPPPEQPPSLHIHRKYIALNPIHFHPLNATPPKRIAQYKTNLGNVRWNLIQCFVAVLCVYFFFIILF